MGFEVSETWVQIPGLLTSWPAVEPWADQLSELQFSFL